MHLTKLKTLPDFRESQGSLCQLEPFPVSSCFPLGSFCERVYTDKTGDLSLFQFLHVSLPDRFLKELATDKTRGLSHLIHVSFPDHCMKEFSLDKTETVFMRSVIHLFIHVSFLDHFMKDFLPDKTGKLYRFLAVTGSFSNSFRLPSDRPFHDKVCT